MAKYTYTELFEKCPDSFLRFDRLAGNASTFLNFLRSKDLMRGIGSVLSIGAGQGELEIRLMRDYGAQVAYIDPTPSYVRSYCEDLSKFDSSRLAIEVFEGRFEDYVPSRKFDLVLSVHSWYAIGFNEQALRKALSCKNARGRLIIAIASQNSFHIELANLLSEERTDYLTAEKIQDWLNGLGIKYDVAPALRKVQAKDLRSGDRLAPNGKALFEFLGRSPFREFPQKVIQQCTELLDRYEKNGELDIVTKCLIIQ